MPLRKKILLQPREIVCAKIEKEAVFNNRVREASTMQLRHLKTVSAPAADQSQIQKVTAVAWSPNNLRLAVATQDRIIQLFDENGERRDRFQTRPNMGTKNYVIKAMAFSPDSTKLAVAQSDQMVYVYKLGLEWGEKKTICNKFPTSSPVTSLVWPVQHPGELVYGLAEGKVKAGNIRGNKPMSLYTTSSYVVALASNPEGTGFVAAHLDGSIYRFLFDDGTGNPLNVKLCHHSTIPTSIAWGAAVVVASSDNKVTMYGADGRIQQQFDYSSDESEKEFTCAGFAPSGECCAVGSFNRLRLFSFDRRSTSWSEETRQLDNMYTITALGWRGDGARLCIGGLVGNAEVFDACVRRFRFKGTFEMTYVSPSQVIVKRLVSGARIQMRSLTKLEITKISVYNDRYVVAHTADTLLVGDLENCTLSEVPWRSAVKERFFFDNPAVCMVFSAGELALIEYNKSEILGSIRTEYMNPHLISVRLPTTGAKKIAYLMDVHTVCVSDLASGLTIANISHDSKIDWLEMNQPGTKLLFRDKKRHLHIVDIATQQRTTLLDYCAYVQWVPNSDVVVAQNRGSLCVWYNIDAPGRPTVIPIKGEVVEIERAPDRTEVVVDEGSGTTVSYPLNDALINFGSALDGNDLARAATTLESSENSPEVDAMWSSLAQKALENNNLAVAERCYAALGDTARAKFLRATRKIANYASSQFGGDGMEHHMVKTRLLTLNKQFAEAERVYLDQSAVDEAIEMYQELHMFDDSLRVAAQRGHEDLEAMRAQYFQYLLQSHQEDKAAQLKEQEGDMMAAINLYLKAAMPARAAGIISSGSVRAQPDMVERIASALLKHGLFEKAGDFFEKMGMADRALPAYRKGHLYRRAVDLARREFSDQVVSLEEEWGEYCMSLHQSDQAVKHFIEAGRYLKAMEAAVQAKQWTVVLQIADGLREDEAQPFIYKVAKQLEESQDHAAAEKYYVRSGRPEEAVTMYLRASKLEQAGKVAKECMPDNDANRLFVKEAEKLEKSGKLREAERVYITAKEPDLAINMYKKARRYDDMIRLVGQFHKELLAGTHAHLAKQLETDPASLAQAEHHYVASGDWAGAVKMYRSRERWEDVLRVARQNGGTTAWKQHAYLWAMHLGGDAGAKLLHKLGLGDMAIDYLCENNLWDQAIAMATGTLRSKLQDVHYKHAMALEDEGRFSEAEAAFVIAGKPKEAVDMYIHTRDWISALRVAEAHESSAVPTVYYAQAKLALADGNRQIAEQMFVRAGRADDAVRMYMEVSQWQDALRVAAEHAPHMTAEVHAAYDKGAHQPDAGGDPVSVARMYESRGDYTRAIDSYLKVSTSYSRDANLLEEVWENAVRLAMNYVPERHNDVVSVVSIRLVELKRIDSAAELWVSIDRYREAIDIYLRARMFDAARRIAQHHAPQLLDMVETARTQTLVDSKDAQALISSGQAGAGLDVLVQQDRWQEVLQLASEQGPQMAQKYAVMYAARMFNLGKISDALAALAQHGAPADAVHFDFYTQLVRSAFRINEYSAARDMLTRLIAALAKLPQSKETELFGQLHQIAYYSALKNDCLTHGLVDIAAKQAVALLRHVGEIPADKAFFQAGSTCKDASMLSYAFVFWNRFLDIADSMDEDSSTYLDNSDFVTTDIPYDFPMPTESGVTGDEKEEARNWVLGIVSNSEDIEQSLPERPCERCNKQIYEGACTCSNCKTKYDPCIISGFPVLKSTRVQCRSCSKPANRAEWNKYVTKVKTCPNCSTLQNPVY